MRATDGPGCRVEQRSHRQYEVGRSRCDNRGDQESIESGAKSPGTGWFNGGLVNDGGRLCILWLLNPVEVAP